MSEKEKLRLYWADRLTVRCEKDDSYISCESEAQAKIVATALSNAFDMGSADVEGWSVSFRNWLSARCCEEGRVPHLAHPHQQMDFLTEAFRVYRASIEDLREANAGCRKLIEAQRTLIAKLSRQKKKRELLADLWYALKGKGR